MRLFILLSFIILNFNFSFPSNASETDVSMPRNIVGAWGYNNEECLAYHRNPLAFTLEKNGHFYWPNKPEREIENWFINPRIEDNVTYLTSDLQKDSMPILGIVYKKNSELYLEFWGVKESVENAIQLRKCTLQDAIKGIGHDTLKSGDDDLDKARQIAFTLGYAMGAANICKNVKIQDDTAKYIAKLAQQAALKYAEENNKLPPEKWAQNFSFQRTLQAVEIASIDKKAIPSFCDEIFKAYGENGWVVDGLIE